MVGRIGFADRAEEWRAVPEYEGLYEVSSFGRVRSLRYDPPKTIRTGPDKDGYLLVWLFKEGKRSGRALHRLVCLVFHGEQPDAFRNEVAHLDGSRTNARADNLKWVTKLENHAHMRLHGTRPVGERKPNALLTDQAVREIRRDTRPRDEIAAQYGVRPCTIYDVQTRKSWRHVREA